MKKININYFIYSVLLMFFVLAAMTAGCKSSTTSQTPTGEVLTDDGYTPDSPKWSPNTPIQVQKLGEKYYQVILDWEAVKTNTSDDAKKNIIGYNIYRRRESTVDKKIATIDTTQHYYIDKTTDLVEGEKFVYTVSAFDNFLRESLHNDVQTVIIQPEKNVIPKSPSNLFCAPGAPIAYGRDRGEIILSWCSPTENMDNSAADNITEFEIESHATDDSTWRTLAKIPGSKNIFIDSNLVQGTYFYRIRAKNSNGNYSQYVDGNFSIFGRLDESAPGVITNLEVYYQKGRNILTWVNPKRDADGKTLDMLGVKIYRKVKNSQQPFELIKILPADTTYTDFNINLDTYYIYTLTTFDRSGNESVMSKPASSEPKAVYLETPKNLYARLTKQSGLSLNWDAVQNAKTYNVYRAPIENGVYSKSGESAVNSYLMTIPYGNVFYYKVSALDENGVESSLSNSLQVIGDSLYKTIEAETYLGDISKGINAIGKPFVVEVNVIDYADTGDRGAYLRFMPISTADGEAIKGVPLAGKDSDAVDDYFELNQFMTSGAYQCEVWAKKGQDCGIYQVEVEGAKFGPFDTYSVNNREMLKFPINFTVAEDLTNHGKNVKFRFTCTGKNQDSSDYNLNLDRVIIFR